MLIIIFAHAHLAVVPSSPEAATAALAPFADEREARAAGLGWDDYADAAQSVQGQEFTVSQLIEVGVLDEDGNPKDGVVVLRAA